MRFGRDADEGRVVSTWSDGMRDVVNALKELTPEQAINIGNELVRAAGEERRTYSTEEE